MIGHIKINTTLLLIISYILFFPSISISSQKPSFGFFLKPLSKTHHEVTYVFPKSVAKKRGIKVGDVIIEIDSKAMTEREAVHYLQTKIGAICSFTVMRNNKKIFFNLPIEHLEIKYDLHPHWYIIDDLLQKGEKVSLIIVPDKVEYVIGIPTDFDTEAWERSTTPQLVGLYENIFLRSLSEDVNFKLIDRSEISKILEEINFSQTNYISKDTRIKIGQLTGATHLLVVNFTRTISSKQKRALIFSQQKVVMEQGITAKLINIKTGEILSSIAVSQELDAKDGRRVLEEWHRTY